MLDHIRIKNFKSIKDVQYDATNLNILMGLNGSGKSSFIQTMLLLKQEYSSPMSSDFLMLNGEIVLLGTQDDLFYCYNRTDEISITFRYDGRPAASSIKIPFTDPVSDVAKYEFEKNEDEDNDLIVLKDKIHAIQYISANRLGPQQEHLFGKSKIIEKQWGISGEYAVAYLSENWNQPLVNENLFFCGVTDPALDAQTSAWMSVISPGTIIHTDKLTNINKAILSVSFAKGINQHKFRPQNVGFGISFALPIILMLLTAKAEDCLIMENPEAHIHPRGQAELGRLIALCANSGVQIFVETHSDHIVNGIRVAVRKNIIDHKKVNIAFFHRVDNIGSDGVQEQYSEICNIKIDRNGELSNYPDGFLDEWNNQLLELM